MGDSRIYLLRDQETVQLTEDHSLVNELIKRGKVTKEGFATSAYKAYKNAVTRAVGVYETVQVDTLDLDILPGDQFLLCSDGLHAYLDDSQIRTFLGTEDITAVPTTLVDHANTGGGHDNITAVVLRAKEEEQAESENRRARELRRKTEMLKRMPLFRHLSFKEIIALLNVTEVVEFDADETILAEGESGDEMFIIIRGRVQLTKEGAPITELGPGAHLGEMALVDRTPFGDRHRN